MADRISQIRSNCLKDHLSWFLCLSIFIFFFESCSPKPAPAPAPATKVKSKKPDWLGGKNMDSDHWFGIGSVAVGDSVSPKTIAIESIQKQIYHQIKKHINNEFDISDSLLESICEKAISSRIEIIKTLTKEAENYTDGKKKYTLLSLNKKIYSQRLEKRLEELYIGDILNRIEGPPGKENFLLLSESIQMIVGSIDIIIKKELQSKNSKSKMINKVRNILNDYNDRVLFTFDPRYLNSVPISNDQQELTIRVVDNVDHIRLDSIDVHIEYDGLYDSQNWISDSTNDFLVLLPNVVSNTSYVLTIGVDYRKIFRGDYLDLFSVKQNFSNVTVIPRNIKIYSTESISTLGTGLEYSAIYDSIKSCFEDNYGAEFVDHHHQAELLMNIEVATKENMRRESRKQPFKSEAFFILSLEYRQTGNSLFSQVIAKTEALDYDFVERASIRALKDLSSSAIHSICQ